MESPPKPHPYYVAHYTEVEAVVLAWRAQIEQDAAKAVVSGEVMEKMVDRKAGMLAQGLSPVEAESHRQRAEADYDRENPGVRDQAYAHMRGQLAQWQRRQNTPAKSGCLIFLAFATIGVVALAKAAIALT